MRRPALLRAALITLLGIALLLPVLAHAAFTITRNSSPVFYTDSAKNLRCNYLGFNVTSTTAVTDAWARTENFGGGFLALGGNDDGIYHLGSFAAGQTKSVYTYVCSSYSSGATAAGQSYDLKVYERNPTLVGAQQLGTQSFTTTIDDSVIQANPNTVSVIFSGPNPGVLGGVITMTVQGDTGTIGNAPGPNGPLAFTPASYTSWRADAYELFATNVSFTGGNSGSFDNQLYFASLASGTTTSYTATYYFRAVSTTSTSTSLSPIGYIASGTQIKHTSTTSGAYSGGGLLPIDPATNTLNLTKLVSAATLPQQGGTVTYTLRVTNSGSYPVTLDDFTDTLPAGVSYVSNSSSFNGSAIANPTISGATLTWNAAFVIPAGGARDLVFQATMPATPGLYTNSAVARVGATVIDTTLTTTDNVPATAQTRVLAAPGIAKNFSPVATAAGGTLQLSLTLSNPNAANTLNGVAVSDIYPAGLVNTSAPSPATTCSPGTITGGVPGGNTIGINGVSLAPGASCTVTVNVTSAVVAAYTNSTGTVASTNGGSGTTATALATFTTRPTLAKSFSPASVPLGTPSRLTVVVTNNNTVSLTNLAFSDILPAGMTVGATPDLANTCGGAVSGATAGSTSFSLAGGAITLPATTCQIAVDVVASLAGVYSNTTSGATSDQSGAAGPVSNTATLTVLAPPTLAKAFSPNAIGVNETSVLTITLTNPNATAITGAALTDTYPAGLVNTGTPAGATTCAGGTVTASAGGGSVVLAGGTIPANGSCTVTVNVTSALAGTYNNSTGPVTTANAGTGTATNAVLTVTLKPSIAKSFSVNLGTGVTTMSITITNNFTSGISGAAFSDTFPVGLAVASPPALTNTCGGTVSGATAGSTSINLSGGSIASAGGTCTITLAVEASSAGVYSNQTSGVSSTQTGAAGNPSNLAAFVAPGLIKTFTPNTTGPGDTVRMTVTVINASGSVALTGVQFSDTYPSGLTNTATPAVSNTCGGSVSGGAAGGNSIGLTGGSVAAGGTCVVGVNVQGASVTSYYNQTGTVRSNQGVGVDAADTLYVTNKPTITKTFSPSTILVGAFSTMTITIENNHTAGITGIAFSDTFPANLKVNATPSLTNTCGGTVTGATAGSTSISLSGGSIATANVTCQIALRVDTTGPGMFTNQTSGGTSSTTGATPGPVSNAAVLTVNLNAPTVAKAFAPNLVAVDAASALTITLTNPNATAITGVSFTDTYPAEITNLTGPTSTCGGSATAAIDGNSLSLSGGTIPASGSCTVSVSVKAATGGTFNNTTGTVTTGNAGNGTAANATLTAYRAPVVAKTYGAATVALGGSTTMTLTVTNPGSNPGALSGIFIRDVFPTTPGQMTLANTTVTNSCTGSTAADSAGGVLNAGDVGVQVSGISLAAGASCAVTFNVTVPAAGAYSNTTDAITATTPLVLTGNTTSATLGTISPATVAKAYSPNPIVAGGTTVLTITLTNPNPSTAITGVAFTDANPAGVLNTATPAGATTCAGGTVTAAANGGSVALSGATIAAGSSCTVTVNQAAAAAGAYANAIAAGDVTSTNAGSNTAAANATLNAYAPPTLAKAFGAATIAPAGTTTLTLTVTNPAANPGTVSGISIRDVFPVAPGAMTLANTTVTNTCAGSTVTDSAGGALDAGDAGVQVTGISLAPNASCAVTFNVTASTVGSYTNTTDAITATTPVAPTGATANASVSVAAAALGIAKTFSPNPVGVNEVSVLTFTITNSNTVAQTGVAFSDTYPVLLVNANPPDVTSTCGGTISGGTAGGNSIALSGGTVAGSGSCTVSVKVTSSTAGNYDNTSGAVSSAEAGAGSTASARLTVLQKPTIAKSFALTSVPVNGASTLTLTLANPNAGQALSGVAFTDTFPGGLVVSGTPGVTNTCSGSITGGAAVNGAIGLTGGTIAASSSCTITVQVTSASAGTYVNTSGGVSSTQTGSAGAASNSATLSVLLAPSIAKAFNPNPIGANGVSTLTFTVTNPNDTAFTGLAFTDVFPVAPSAMTIANTTTTNTCGGILTDSGGGGLNVGDVGVQLAGGSLAANSTCTVSINVIASATGSYANTSGAVSATNGGTGNTASATLVVAGNPLINKVFAPSSVSVNALSTMTITITNSSAGTLTGLAFTDTFPAGLVVHGTPNLTNTCNGTVTDLGSGAVNGGDNGIQLAGGTIAPNATCTVSVAVISASPGKYDNTTGAVSTAETGAANTSNTATLTVVTGATIAKAFSPASIPVNGVSTMTLTITNPNAIALSGLALTDNFPAGLQVTATPTLSNTCGGTVTGATAGSTALSFSGGDLSAGPATACVISLQVTGTIPGNLVNSTSGVSSNEAPTGAGSNAAILVATAPDLRLTKTHAGNLTVGGTHAYTIVVNNTQGGAPTSGTITVTDTLPSGLAYVAVGSGGAGWSCGAAGQVVTCTTSEVIPAFGTSANPLTINVNVLPAAVPNVTNTVVVSGGGEPAQLNGNNTALDYTIVSAAAQNSFLTDGVQTVLPGGVVFYTHRFLAGIAGNVGFTAANAAAPAIGGWSNIVYRDNNCDSALNGADTTAPLTGTVAVTPGDQVCIIVKESAPAGAPVGAQDLITVTAAFTPTVGTEQKYTRTDLTTVGTPPAAGLTLAKEVRNVTLSGAFGTNNTANPGHILEYRITYNNTSSQPLLNILIHDSTPPFTLYQSAACSSPPPNLTGCSVTTQPAVGGTGGLQWTLTGSLASGAFGAVSYSVQVQP